MCKYFYFFVLFAIVNEIRCVWGDYYLKEFCKRYGAEGGTEPPQLVLAEVLNLCTVEGQVEIFFNFYQQ